MTEKLEPIMRSIVRIGERDPNNCDWEGSYSPVFCEIKLVRAFGERPEDVERRIEETIEHEVIHHILYWRVDDEAYEKFDNIAYYINKADFSRGFKLIPLTEGEYEEIMTEEVKELNWLLDIIFDNDPKDMEDWKRKENMLWKLMLEKF